MTSTCYLHPSFSLGFFQTPEREHTQMQIGSWFEEKMENPVAEAGNDRQFTESNDSVCGGSFGLPVRQCPSKMHTLLRLEIRSPQVVPCCKYFSLYCERRARTNSCSFLTSLARSTISCDVDLCCTKQMLQPKTFLGVDKRHTPPRILEHPTNIWKPIVNLIDNQVQTYPWSIIHNQAVATISVGRENCVFPERAVASRSEGDRLSSYQRWPNITRFRQWKTVKGYSSEPFIPQVKPQVHPEGMPSETTRVSNRPCSGPIRSSVVWSLLSLHAR